MFSSASLRELAISLAPLLFLSRRYKAILWADFFPTPGITVKDLINTKGKKQLIELCCKNPTDAKIAEKLGVDMIIVASERPYNDYDVVRGKLNINISNFEFKLFDFYSIRKAAKRIENIDLMCFIIWVLIGFILFVHW